ncbi:uncharacterized protein VTP21DRAFT_3759 [Calcarisporiella thermophila]|uniref:uncharacterized protein n=1 Tax=Calcarisporiella thermophila TaxID=911321 RepID=UPI00374453CD
MPEISHQHQENPQVSERDLKVLEAVFNPEAKSFIPETHASLPAEPEVPTEEATPNLSPELIASLKQREAEAVQLAEADRTEDALRIFTEIIDKSGGVYASGLNNRAQLYRLMGDLDKALVDLNQAIEVGHGQTKVLKQAYTQRAIIRKMQGDAEGALADFEIGAKLGNPIAKTAAVAENPYAKMCNAIVMEMMQKEFAGSNQ